MPKMKTSSSAKKRFKLSGAGKVLRRRAFKSHLLEHKSAKRKRFKRRDTGLFEADTREVGRSNFRQGAAICFGTVKPMRSIAAANAACPQASY